MWIETPKDVTYRSSFRVGTKPFLLSAKRMYRLGSSPLLVCEGGDVLDANR